MSEQSWELHSMILDFCNHPTTFLNDNRTSGAQSEPEKIII